MTPQSGELSGWSKFKYYKYQNSQQDNLRRAIIMITKTKDQYSSFADLYDLEMYIGNAKVFYKEWHDSLIKAARRYKINLNTIVDLACGTGNTTVLWGKKRGRSVVGVDASDAMLREAKKKSKTIKWYKQDLRKLNIKERADAVTCHFDALNHILKPQDLQKVFRCVAQILNRGGLFQFDMNTKHWFKWLSVHEKLFPIGRHYFIARNAYDTKRKIGTFHQLWFVKDGKGNSYSKREVRVNERAYDTNEIHQMIKKAGLKLLATKIQRKIDGKSIRILYLVRKPI